MRDNDAVNRPFRRKRDIVHDAIVRPPEVFDAGDKRDVELAARESLAERGGMIELNRAVPAADQWARVEIFDAADLRSLYGLPGLRSE